MARSLRVRDALAAGITAEQLRSRRWERQFWGVRSRVPLNPEEAFAPRLAPAAFFFGVSAARLHRLPLPARVPPLPVHVAVPAGRRRPAARDIAAHHVDIDPEDVITRSEVRLTSVERTWCDLAAAGLTLGELVAVGDAILHPRRSSSTLAALRAATARYRGRRGARTIAAALPLLDGRADSAPESELRVALVLAGLPTPLANPAVVLGPTTVHVDIAWPDHRLGIEYEGDHHRTERDQWHYDIRRYDHLAEHGWTIIRATAADLRDPQRVIARVSRHLAESTHFR